VIFRGRRRLTAGPSRFSLGRLRLTDSIFGKCPECGAECSFVARKCWMCGASLVAKGAGGAAVGENIFVARRGASESRPPQYREMQASVDNASLAFMALALVIVGCGIAREAPGLGIVYAIVMLPAMLATVVKRSRRIQSHRSAGWGDTIADLFSGIAIGIGILVALPVVAIIAVLIFCAVTASSQSFH
jgi:hypothetical protein